MSLSKWMFVAALTFGTSAVAPAAPVAGCYTVTPAGSWTESATALSTTLSFGNSSTYAVANATLAHTEADATGEWDLINTYTGGLLSISNLPAAAWFSPCTTAGNYVEAAADIIVKLRSTRYESTNAGYLEFEVVAQADWMTLLGTYAGSPTVTVIPETPDSVEITQTAANFGSVEICIGKEVVVDIRPGSRVNPLNVKSRGVVPVAIRGSAEFDVTAIDPASLRLQCVAPLRWSYGDVTRDGKKDLFLKFDTQSLVQNLPSNGDRELVTLVLTGLLQDGTPISGEDQVVILNKGKPSRTAPGKSKTPPGRSDGNHGKGKGKGGR